MSATVSATSILSQVRAESHIQFFPFFLRPPERADGAWVMGVAKTALAIELPEEATEAVHALQAGRSIAETAILLEQKYGEPFDLVDLVQEVAATGLVASIDDAHFAPPEQIGQQWLARISPKAVGWLFARPTLLITLALILLGPLLLLWQPEVRPRTQDLFWTHSYTLDLLLLLLLGPLLVLKHELGHLLAARAKDLPAELTFGHRLYSLVAVSRIGEIWKLKRGGRLLIYSAGMINDCVSASLLLLLLTAANHELLLLSPPLISLLRLLVLSEYVGISWEFQVFLKTDVYHILTELTDRHDLPEQSWALLREWWRMFRRDADDRQTRPAITTDKLTLGFTFLSLVGISASYVWLFVYLLPAIIGAFHEEMVLLLSGISTGNLLALLDGLVALVIQAGGFLLLVWSIFRK